MCNIQRLSEPNATNAGIITDYATYRADSKKKGKYAAIQCDLPTTTRKASVNLILYYTCLFQRKYVCVCVCVCVCVQVT
jgi:hypothetical protein